jgi:hypothetical protein
MNNVYMKTFGLVRYNLATHMNDIINTFLPEIETLGFS